MANIFSKHRNKLREQSKKKKNKKIAAEESLAESSSTITENSVIEQDAKSEAGLIKCQILSLSHEGRGIAKNKGKTQFVHQALPNETVLAEVVAHRSKYDELKAVKVLKPSNERVEPRCKYYGICGGCSLQHLSHEAQLKHKEHVLFDQLQRFGNVAIAEGLNPIESEPWHYRSRTRLSVDYGRKGETLRIGYRKKGSKEILDIDACPVLEESLSNLLVKLKPLILSLSVNKAVGHLELSSSNDGISILVRHIKPFTKDDLSKLTRFAEQEACLLFLQPEGVESILKVWPEDNITRLSYQLEVMGRRLDLSYHPKDFTQINLGVNQKMLKLALDELELNADEKALDLFSGLGNFTLAMALFCKQAIGVEGSLDMVERGQCNAQLNKVDKVSFFESNLYADFSAQAWAQSTYDKILIDPPRDGALEVVRNISRFEAKRIVYISCNPATLARDAGVLVQQGYHLSRAGILDMFPHTEHLESIAVFDRT